MNPEIDKALRAARALAQGEFPRGRLNAEDEGALAMAVSNDGNVVKIDFGKNVQWFALPADNAIQLAQLLIRHACQCGANKPIIFTIGKDDKV